MAHDDSAIARMGCGVTRATTTPLVSTQVWPTLVVDLGAPLDARRAHEERVP